jgi:hypothetical protein
VAGRAHVAIGDGERMGVPREEVSCSFAASGGSPWAQALTEASNTESTSGFLGKQTPLCVSSI